MINTEIPIDELASGKPLAVDLTADSKACAEIAERFEWLEVRSLTARITLKSIAHGAYQASGEVRAEIIQSCRLSGNPVAENLTVDVDERFTTIDDDDSEMEIDPLAVSVERLLGDKIPIGEMVVQLVGLEASAWPRDPAADPAAESDVSPPSDEGNNQFASLVKLKKKR